MSSKHTISVVKMLRLEFPQNRSLYDRERRAFQGTDSSVVLRDDRSRRLQEPQRSKSDSEEEAPFPIRLQVWAILVCKCGWAS